MLRRDLLALKKMKEAMWAADPTGEFRFSDATDPSQGILFVATEDGYQQLLVFEFDRSDQVLEKLVFLRLIFNLGDM